MYIYIYINITLKMIQKFIIEDLRILCEKHVFRLYISKLKPLFYQSSELLFIPTFLQVQSALSGKKRQ